MNTRSPTQTKTKQSFTPLLSGILQRQCAECKQEQQLLQRHSANEVPPVVKGALNSHSQPLDTDTRNFMESRFGHDFSSVRVHTDAKAAESARAVNALAYTVGRDVVFDAGQYAPETKQGKRLLAHELTHVVQQSAGGISISTYDTESEARHEVEANHVAQAVMRGDTTIPAISSSAIALRRDTRPNVSDEETQARQAEIFGDIRSLCRLRLKAPNVVTEERARNAATKRYPDKFLYRYGDVCKLQEFSPLFLSPLELLPETKKVTIPTSQSAGGGSLNSSASGLSLENLTNFKFNLGALRFNFVVPKSATISLPFPAKVKGAEKVEFVLKGESSGALSFSTNINGLEDIRISISAGVNIDQKTASAGIEIASKSTVCRADDPVTLKEKIKTAGEKLQTAVNKLQNPPQVKPGEETPKMTDQLKDIAEAIGDIYDAVDKSKKACTQRPVVKVGIQGQTFLDSDPTKPQPSTVGATFEVNF
jgi:Domain of unknown function (DUF4157)